VTQPKFQSILVSFILLTAGVWGHDLTVTGINPAAKTTTGVTSGKPSLSPNRYGENVKDDDLSISETAMQAFRLRLDGQAADARTLLENGFIEKSKGSRLSLRSRSHLFLPASVRFG